MQESTKNPVTINGWYELLSGKVARFHWNQGILEQKEIVESWEEVAKLKDSWEDCYQE